MFITLTSSKKQTCKFENKIVHLNTYDGTNAKIYACVINATTLFNESDRIVTDTRSNRYSNSKVQMVDYSFKNQIYYIPKSIFVTFPNLLYFRIYSAQNLEVLKPEYLKNAQSLKLFRINHNNIAQLDENLFVEAPNLVHLNLQKNKIVIIHKNAFNGLFQLAGIYLQGNNIKFLHPLTFSHLTSLLSLDLTSNICINKIYKFLPSKFFEIENETGKSCPYDFYLNFFNQKQNMDQNSTACSTSLTAKNVSNNEDEIQQLRAENLHLQELNHAINNELNTLRAGHAENGNENLQPNPEIELEIVSDNPENEIATASEYPDVATATISDYSDNKTSTVTMETDDKISSELESETLGE